MRDFKEIMQSAANLGGKVLRNTAHAIREEAEKGAELAGTGVNIVVDGLATVVGLGSKRGEQCMRPASPMVRRKRDFIEWEFTKKMNAVGL